MTDTTSVRCRVSLRCALLLAFLLPALAWGKPPELVPLQPAESAVTLSWSGLHRTRYARLWNPFRPGSSGDDQVVELRTSVRAEYDLGNVSLVGELQDSRAYLTDENGAVSTAVVNTLDFTEAHVRIGAADEAGTSITLGRFLLELGAGRLIAAEAYRNVARGYTGILTETVLGNGRLTAFAALPVLPMPSDQPALLRNARAPDEEDVDLALYGVHWRLPMFPTRFETELYLYVLDEDDDRHERETPDRRLATGGVRIWHDGAAGEWDFEIEMIRQIGTRRASAGRTDFRELDIEAAFSHLEAGYTFRRRWSPRISLEYEHGSGDADPADGTWGRFDALFGTRRTDLAPTSIYGALGRENIDTVAVRVSLAPTESTDAFVAYRTVGLAEPADFFASTGVRDASARSGRDGGTQIDARYRRWLSPGRLRLDVGATLLFNGDFLHDAPNATRAGDTTFLYGDVTYTFRSR